MTLEDIVGSYHIIGTNQNDSPEEYRGTLSLTLDQHKRIVAEWCIHDNQLQFGYGFFKDNILVINFYYYGSENDKYKGVVVYRCLTSNILDGFWSEKHGDLDFLGEERCFKIDTTNQQNPTC